MDSIFAYTDYCKYLKDYFQESKRTKRYFSLKKFADKAGFKARDYILRVMNGQRNLSKSGIFMLSQAMSFSEKETEYFENLVGFNQARTNREKDYYYRKVSAVKKHSRYQKLRKDQYEYFSNWYHPVIRSLLPVMDFKDDFKKLGKFLDPPITAKQAKDSVNLLLGLGLLKRSASGKYSVSSLAVTTGDEVVSLAVANFHKKIMDLAKQSIDTHDPANRDISSVTMSLSKEGFVKIKSELQAFRKKVMAIASADSGEDRAVQLSSHLFPMSKTRTKNEK
jgi:uncharacterized protein (TIGR02147 family)